jgi:hypothetical protein
MILLPQKVAYRGTISSLRISSVDGTAFLDNCAALVPYADGNHLIEIYDASGRQLVGYLSAQGTGETLGSELVTNGSMETADPPSGWSLKSSTTFAAEADERTGGTGSKSGCVTSTSGSARGVYQACVSSAADGKMYALGLWHKNKVGTTKFVRLTDAYEAVYVTSAALNSATWAYYSTYATAANFNVYVFLYAGTVTNDSSLYDDVSFRQVLTPSTDGVLIVSTKGGAVPNFAYKNTSFTYNAETNYVVVRKAR